MNSFADIRWSVSHGRQIFRPSPGPWLPEMKIVIRMLYVECTGYFKNVSWPCLARWGRRRRSGRPTRNPVRAQRVLGVHAVVSVSSNDLLKRQHRPEHCSRCSRRLPPLRLGAGPHGADVTAAAHLLHGLSPLLPLRPHRLPQGCA